MRVGDTVDITVTTTYVDDSGLGDAAALAIIVRDPDGAETTYAYPSAAVTRLSLGTYRMRITIPETAAPGTWRCRARSTGGASGSGVVSFLVHSTWT